MTCCVCLNCLYSNTINNKSDDCCKNPNINSKGICINCATIHLKFKIELEFQENNAYETNVLFKIKKVHNPYKYLKKNYPEIKDKKIYDFILEAIQFIQNFYKLKRKPFTKYVPYLYNFYRENDESIPELYEIEKNLILEKEIIDKLNELTNNKNKSKIIKQKNDKIFDNRYYYFNKSKNEYFKKSRYCSYNDCIKIANFKDGWSNKKYCKNHLDDDADVININNPKKENMLNLRINIPILYIMVNMSVLEKIKCQRIDKFFYRNPEGTILKYSQYCIEKNCKTLASYNYENLKAKFCNNHKLEKMVNVKRGHKLCQDCEKGYLKECNTPKCKYTIKNYKNATKYMKLKIIKYLKKNNIEFYMCRICSEIVDKEHFDTEEHIEKFNSVCKIKIEKSLKDSFITIKFKFIDNRYNYIYTDLYFKNHIREIILKNIETNKYYKSYILKKNVLEFNQGNRDPMYISERHDSNDILYDLENIEHLESNKERNLKPYLIKNSSSDYNYKIKKMYEDIDKINFKESGNSIYYINSSGCHIHISECELLKGSNYNFEKIPKIFYTSRVINVIKNKDQKCFIYCYIRKYLNNVNNHKDRISLKDKQIVKKLEEELNFNFDNVKIKDLSKIENLLETNTYVYTCD